MNDNVNHLFLIACQEARLLWRERVFQVLVFMSLACVIFLQVAMQGRGIAYSRDMIALPESVPLLNAYFYNIVQLFIVLFLVTRSSSWYHKATGSMENIHVRPFYNVTYLAGKFTGVLFVMLEVNLLVVFCGLLFNLFGTLAPFGGWYFLFYMITLTFPTFVFSFGVGVWLNSVMKTRFLSLACLLFLFYTGVYWLPGCNHGLFDFTGNSLPNVFSAMTGHVARTFYLSHRWMFLLLGCGFLFLSARGLERLPNNKREVPRFLWWGVGVCVAGVVILGSWWGVFKSGEKAREACIASFARHWQPETCRVSNHEVTLQQVGDRLIGSSKMVVRNPEEKALSRLVLFLNSGLRVSRVEVDGKEVGYTRDNQSLVIEYVLTAGDSASIQVRYEGTLERSCCDLDIPGDEYKKSPRQSAFFNPGRDNFFVSDVYLLLTPASIWYPVSIPPCNPVTPAVLPRDYTSFRLTLVQPRQLTVLAHGHRYREDGHVCIVSPGRQDGLSLCAGGFARKRLETHGLKIDWYYLPGHDFVTPHFSLLTRKDVDKELLQASQWGVHRNKWSDFHHVVERWSEEAGNLPWLTLVESPLSFSGYYRTETGKSDMVQPGMVFYPERGFGLDIPVFEQYKVNYTSDWSTPRDLERQLCGKIESNFSSARMQVYDVHPLRKKLLPRRGFVKRYKMIYRDNLYHLSPLTRAYIYSPHYPGIDMVFRAFMMNEDRVRSIFFEISFISIAKNELKALEYLQTRSLGDALRDEQLSGIVREEIVLLKCQTLLHELSRNVPEEDVMDFLFDFYMNHQGEVRLEELAAAMKPVLHVDLLEILPGWYECSRPPLFLVREMSVKKGMNSDGKPFGMGSFKIMNVGDSPAWIKIRVDGGKRSRSLQKFQINPGEAKEARMTGNHIRNLAVNVGLSRNFPSVYSCTQDGIAPLDTTWGIFDISPEEFFKYKEEGIVVDNDDPGFRLIEPPGKWLYRLFGEKEQKDEVFSGGTLPYPRWEHCWLQGAYGDTARSVYAKGGGKGGFKAEWTADIPERGIYEVLVYLIDGQYTSLKDPDPKYYYTLSGGKKEEEIVVRLKTINERWNSLGRFELFEGKSRLVLSDKGMSELIVYADAVKWVRVKD